MTPDEQQAWLREHELAVHADRIREIQATLAETAVLQKAYEEHIGVLIRMMDEWIRGQRPMG
jgi:hypothetical protein